MRAVIIQNPRVLLKAEKNVKSQEFKKSTASLEIKNEAQASNLEEFFSLLLND